MSWLCLPTLALFSGELSPCGGKKVTGCQQPQMCILPGKQFQSTRPSHFWVPAGISWWSREGTVIPIPLALRMRHRFIQFTHTAWVPSSALSWGGGAFESHGLTVDKVRFSKDKLWCYYQKEAWCQKDTSCRFLLHRPCFQAGHLVKETNKYLRNQTYSNHESKYILCTIGRAFINPWVGARSRRTLQSRPLSQDTNDIGVSQAKAEEKRISSRGAACAKAWDENLPCWRGYKEFRMARD